MQRSCWCHASRLGTRKTENSVRSYSVWVTSGQIKNAHETSTLSTLSYQQRQGWYWHCWHRLPANICFTQACFCQCYRLVLATNTSQICRETIRTFCTVVVFEIWKASQLGMDQQSLLLPNRRLAEPQGCSYRIGHTIHDSIWPPRLRRRQAEDQDTHQHRTPLLRSYFCTW